MPGARALRRFHRWNCRDCSSRRSSAIKVARLYFALVRGELVLEVRIIYEAIVIGSRRVNNCPLLLEWGGGNASKIRTLHTMKFNKQDSINRSQCRGNVHVRYSDVEVSQR